MCSDCCNMIFCVHRSCKQSHFQGWLTASCNLLKVAVALQQDGFASDSVRMLQAVRREAPSVQVLLFSATFNDKVKDFAQRVAGDSNQVSLQASPSSSCVSIVQLPR